ncbi:MAG TPA: DNA polymerase III subunit delta' C-terminal domain-containing protein [Phycisphaerae bacterium]|nr:DNA polymerase III subunit delta' C-terminal domain-containing protein [Phycisphaerae bacterium]
MPELLDIIGQDAAIGQLQRVLAGERQPHAYLFAGPGGVGRRTTAVALARTLLCEQPATRPNDGRFPKLPKEAPLRQACGACTSCRMMDADSHPDFQLVYKELARYHEDADVRKRVMQDLGIPVIRSFLIDPANRRAVQGRGKVFVVLEADLTNAAAQNAMLKTLEEPPEGVRIILICRDAEGMLPTTLSRCWVLRFGPLPRPFVTAKLVEAGVDSAEAAFWAAFTDGSVGRALKLAGQGMYEVKRGLLDRLAGLADAGEAELADYLIKATEKLAGEAVAEAKAADGASLAKTLASRQAAGVILELIASAYRDALTVAGEVDRPLVHADRPDVPAALAGRFGPTQLAEVLDQLAEFERLLWRNVNPKTVWDNVAVTCASAAALRL